MSETKEVITVRQDNRIWYFIKEEFVVDIKDSVLGIKNKKTCEYDLLVSQPWSCYVSEEKVS